ncbi:hypothetical protein P19_0175 [Aeromonas phage P19]|uniref:Uncharacterized protein n=1 Tax=Aeromonas phage vB_AdhaM_G2 TaxID=3238786 RepID=A0AB39TYN9_9CAUD|nr:hypothetical protein P19_0175 [Aeromonas phage P19]
MIIYQKDGNTITLPETNIMVKLENGMMIVGTREMNHHRFSDVFVMVPLDNISRVQSDVMGTNGSAKK